MTYWLIHKPKNFCDPIYEWCDHPRLLLDPCRGPQKVLRTVRNSHTSASGNRTPYDTQSALQSRTFAPGRAERSRKGNPPSNLKIEKSVRADRWVVRPSPAISRPLPPVRIESPAVPKEGREIWCGFWCDPRSQPVTKSHVLFQHPVNSDGVKHLDAMRMNRG